MGPKPPSALTDHDPFRLELVNIIDSRQELVRLSELVDWSVFDREFGAQFESAAGRPALPTRLVAGLLYLKHTFALSDEQVVQRWTDKPYWQHFCGERYFQHELPCDPSSIVRWRKRIGEAGVEWLLTQTIVAAKSSGAMKCDSLSTMSRPRVSDDNAFVESLFRTAKYRPEFPTRGFAICRPRAAGPLVSCTGTTTSTITAVSATSAPPSAMRAKTRRSLRATSCIARLARAARDAGHARRATGRRSAP